MNGIDDIEVGEVLAGAKPLSPRADSWIVGLPKLARVCERLR